MDRFERRLAQLLAQLTQCGGFIRFPWFDAAARRAPPRSVTVPEADEEDPIGLVEHEDPDGIPASHATFPS